MLTEDHPVACGLPQPSKVPAIVAEPDDFMSLVLAPDGPKNLDDYLYADRSQLGLPIVSFRNKTIVVLHWLHASCDAMAIKAINNAWTLMLQGKEDEVPSPLANDALKELGKHPAEAHKLAGHRLSVLGMVAYGLRNVMDIVFREKVTRMVCVPGAFLDKLRGEALQELAAESESEEKPFLSEGDILTAWWSRLCTSHLPPDSRMVSPHSLIFPPFSFSEIELYSDFKVSPRFPFFRQGIIPLLYLVQLLIRRIAGFIAKCIFSTARSNQQPSGSGTAIFI
jgi:hypothetical protein